MGTNIEWKARAGDPGRQSDLAARVADGRASESRRSRAGASQG
jgi:hypothetical protein